jgi:hypothetical protein
MVEAIPGNAGAIFLADPSGGRGLTVTLWETEEAALSSDDTAERSRAETVAATGVELLERGRYQVAPRV